MDERPIDVSVVVLGIDADARAKVQRAMDQIASSGDTSTPGGLVTMLREAIATLREVEASWTHAASENTAPMPPEEAEVTFGRAAERARSRFETEVVRAYAGETVRQPPPGDLPEHPSEPGVVVVTLVVAARRELHGAASVRDRTQLEAALDELAAIDPGDFVAMEVVWSPAEDRDRATVTEIEAKYPELTRLDGGVS